MANLGKIRVGDLGTTIDILFQDTSYLDANSAIDLTNSTAIKITFIDPDGTILGPYDMSIINSPGSDGLARYITSGTTSFWTKPGIWRWYGTVSFTGQKYSTNDAVREVLE